MSNVERIIQDELNTSISKFLEYLQQRNERIKELTKKVQEDRNYRKIHQIITEEIKIEHKSHVEQLDNLFKERTSLITIIEDIWSKIIFGVKENQYGVTSTQYKYSLLNKPSLNAPSNFLEVFLPNTSPLCIANCGRKRNLIKIANERVLDCKKTTSTNHPMCSCHLWPYVLCSECFSQVCEKEWKLNIKTRSTTEDLKWCCIPCSVCKGLICPMSLQKLVIEGENQEQEDILDQLLPNVAPLVLAPTPAPAPIPILPPQPTPPPFDLQLIVDLTREIREVKSMVHGLQTVTNEQLLEQVGTSLASDILKSEENMVDALADALSDRQKKRKERQKADYESIKQEQQQKFAEEAKAKAEEAKKKSSSRTGPRQCHNCGAFRHYQKTCPNPKKK